MSKVLIAKDYTAMFSLTIGASTYFSLARPKAIEDDVEAVVTRALASRMGEAAPRMIHWDMTIGSSVVRMGRGGLDPLLLADGALSDGVALEVGLFGDPSRSIDPDSFRDKVVQMARSPADKSFYISGLVSETTIEHGRPAARAGTPDRVSLVLMLHRPDQSAIPFLEALSGQRLSSQLDIVVLVAGGDPATVRRQGDEVGTWYETNRTHRLRRHILAGEMGPAFLANAGAAFATGDVMIFVDPSCLPESPDCLQAMADLAWGAGVATVCPRLSGDQGLLSAGLSLIDNPGAPVVSLCANDLFSDRLRLAAAPIPWLFATQRQRWIAAGGVDGKSDGLWTAPLAGQGGPVGRHLFLGSERAFWSGPLFDDHDHRRPLFGPPRAASDAALRLDGPPSRLGAMTQGHQGGSADVPGMAFSDPASSTSGALSLLVFADQFGPSQSIAFIEGLAGSRAIGRTRVRIVEEASSRDIENVSAHFQAEMPDIVVVSRIGDPAVWSAVEQVARAKGVPIVFHIDDDLFDVPVTLGIERYRIARHPRRVSSLHRIAVAADLVVVSTPVLGDRVRALAGHDRVFVMPIGSGARPPRTRRPRDAGRVRIGYMGSASHNADLAMIAPALDRLMAGRSDIDLVLFGSIAKQPVASTLRGPIIREPGVFGDYAAFRRRLADLDLDIGLAPLRDIAFNRSKTATKWVEYAEAGVAVLGSTIEPYRPMIEAGAMLGASADGWDGGLRRLVDDSGLRNRLVDAADALLRQDYDWDKLEAGLLAALASLRENRWAA